MIAPVDACRCLVEGCPRWTRRCRAGSQWLCADHWRRLSARQRRGNAAYRRRYRKARERHGRGSMEAVSILYRWRVYFDALARAAGRRLPREIADLL